MSEKNFVDLKTLRTDGGTQSRAALNWDVVDEYAAQMQDGDEFPPVVAFDDGKTVWLADGFHRVAAAAQCKMESFPAVIHEGTQRDAILYSVSANNYHGLRFSNADKRENVKKLLLDEEWSEWSDRLIARKCGVSNTFVGSMRKELQLSTVDSKVVKKGDTEYKMDTANIGQNQPSSDDDPNLDPPQQHWLSRYRDETYLSEKPVLWPVNESRTVWVAFDNSAIQIAELIDAEWENVEVDNPATHSGKQTIPALKLFAVNNPAWFHALMSHVASEEYEFVYDPELKQVADRMRTAEYGEHTANMELTPLAAQAQGQTTAATNGDDEHLTDEELEDVTNFLEQMEAEYTDRQFFLDNILDLLDSVDEQLAAAEKTLEDPQDQVYIAYLKRSALFGLGTFRDRIKKVAARPAMLTEIATALLDAATSREVQMVLGKIGQAKLGDTDGDAALETLRIEAEAKLQMIRAAEEAA